MVKDRSLKQDVDITRVPQWYRGDCCHFLPNHKRLAEQDAIIDYLLQGLLPKKPFISKQDFITAFGSCFAVHIANHLDNWGYNTATNTKDPKNSHIVHRADGMVSTFTTRQQFEWAWEDRHFPEDVWYSTADGPARKDEEIRLETQGLLNQTDVFILTFGLSEIWYHKKTGDVFWKAVPFNMFDPQEHGFRVSTVQENIDNIKKIIFLIQKHRPNASIIISLSPVKLLATFRPLGCIVANTVSKAILRSAIDETIRLFPYSSLFYWPSYELITEFYKDPWKNDNRHPKLEIIKEIMQLFRTYYCKE